MHNEHHIHSLEALRALIPSPPAMMHKRLQRALDDYCLTIIHQASLCAVGFIDDALDVTYLDLRNHPVLQAEGQDILLRWPASKPAPQLPPEGLACSLYFVMPGVGFSLRANGRCVLQADASGKVLAFRAEALFLHCSRAKVRADFWQARGPDQPFIAEEGDALSARALAFVAQAPYLLMLTRQGEHTELSPRGDPEGFVQPLGPSTLLIPERPGNKVACTLTNIIDDGALRLSLNHPGSSTVLSVAGRAWLTSDPEVLKPLAVNNKAPKVASVLEVERYRFQHCPELISAGLWDSATYLSEDAIPAFSKMLSEHMNGRGLLGKATTLVVDAVVKHDLKHLY
ncbi:hypothetical protein CNQ84_16140 [Pseudomonas abyssi]|jgi:hypothetical protein|uniref:Pyridoxamine 5'-phosphate oxidase n=1 Tax=Pseudomonas abyssi TaxID=170540 RepID=A0A2A3MEK5_9PSED|nr:hypothetical protein [Pseudomonas abyssi]MAD01663.1 hypothetical protein [Pseudomonadales bacterium]PBK03157.1 hypothetical protein CNQ84_16140 [Pseudomonas abyssi]|tara:strand:- start:2847 stop:3872 length:1026 start_codon:yes stop_codon:yes gene_type:complete